MADKNYPTGGEFLLKDTDPQDAFTPEDFNENQRMFSSTVDGFVQQVIEPVQDDLEYKGKTELGKGLLKQAADMGLLMVDVPEAFGGMGSDKATVMLVSERMAYAGSFAVTHGAQSGIGTLPIVYFGTDEQKQKYLPGIATGEIMTCYALTEPGSGSDALAAATTAVLSADGAHYVLNGTKQYITNASTATSAFFSRRSTESISRPSSSTCTPTASPLARRNTRWASRAAAPAPSSSRT